MVGYVAMELQLVLYDTNTVEKSIRALENTKLINFSLFSLMMGDYAAHQLINILNYAILNLVYAN
jgi:hypothetical protein